MLALVFVVVGWLFIVLEQNMLGACFAFTGTVLAFLDLIGRLKC